MTAGSRSGDALVWIDCEMTGLDPTTNVLVEIAVIVTDAELNPLDEGIDIVIGAQPQQLVAMDPVVHEMHSGSGLLDEIRRSVVTVESAEAQVLEYVQRFVPERRKAPLCVSGAYRLNAATSGLEAQYCCWAA